MNHEQPAEGLVIVRGAADGFVQEIVAGPHRLRSDEPASAGEETGADGERVRDVGRRAVHRTLDPPHDPSADVRNEIADRGAEVEEGGCFGHKLDVTPAVSAFFALSVRSV